MFDLIKYWHEACVNFFQLKNYQTNFEIILRCNGILGFFVYCKIESEAVPDKPKILSACIVL